MRKALWMLALVSAFAPVAAAPLPPAGELQPEPAVALVPRPAFLEKTEGDFGLAPDVVIRVPAGAPEIAELGDRLSAHLEAATGLRLPVVDDSVKSEASRTIRLEPPAPDAALGAEGYELRIAPSRVTLRAPGSAGFFYAIQTLRQLLPAEAVRAERSLPPRARSLPGLHIVDRPRFPWRGLLLDCGRHYLTPDFLKRAIDLMAYHKMNRLHWHLTEDQGWRLEIRKYPRLTDVGAWRGKGIETYGGFYSQDEVRDIVEYARRRHVTVVPEIDMPGHSQSALAAYPELSCTGGPFEVSTRWGVHRDVYCAGNENTFAFIKDILSEVVDLFPGPYVHIGGDECPRDRWKECSKCQALIRSRGLKDEAALQHDLMTRVAGFLESRGRRAFGWDEVAEGGGVPRMGVQAWHGFEPGLEAARRGHDVIMSPWRWCYLDQPLETIDLEKAYLFDPVPPGTSPEQAQHILGSEACLWTEWTPQEAVDRKLFPRLCALAEGVWSPAEKDWKDFARRLTVHARRLRGMGVQVGRADAALR